MKYKKETKCGQFNVFKYLTQVFHLLNNDNPFLSY